MLYSPLRYPGGKNKLSAFISKICIDNGIDGHYVEPYAGGASVALFLLLEGYMNTITINDKDRSIYAFWYATLNHTKELCERIENCEISIENWLRQKEIQKNKESEELLDLGFSTFFLNRTNRSGIIKGGVIGGNEQTGEYRMNCRFNKSELINRIKVIASKRKNITLCSMDAIKLIDKIEKKAKDENVVFYFDPPYYLKASSLYMNFYKKDNHLEVSNRIKSIKNIKWIVSYDNVPEIQSMYSDCIKKEYSFKHTAYNSRLGQEILFFSPDLIIPNAVVDWNPINYKHKRTKTSSKIIYKQSCLINDKV